MPAGPLRERAARLRRVDAVVGSGAGQGRADGYVLQYTSDGIRPLTGGALRPLVSLAAAPLYALTAIARPERFFDSLRAQGAMLTATHSLPDHAAIPADAAAFAGDGNLLISEKDAVKTAAWPEALKARTYVVDYRALLPPELLPALRRKLGV